MRCVTGMSLVSALLCAGPFSRRATAAPSDSTAAQALAHADLATQYRDRGELAGGGGWSSEPRIPASPNRVAGGIAGSRGALARRATDSSSRSSIHWAYLCHPWASPAFLFGGLGGTQAVGQPDGLRGLC